MWQFDILFDVLSAAEHLRLFAALKGLPPDSVDVEVQRRLEEVRLADVANRPAGSFSGGMKRPINFYPTYLLRDSLRRLEFLSGRLYYHQL